MNLGEHGHLTYCTNIHPGESLDAVEEVLRGPVAAVKARLSPDRPFGVGLRLSAQAAEALAAPERFAAFRALLAERDLYVFTINGFPYGPFHGRPVKEAVYRPDWRDGARLAYTDRLTGLLAGLLPDEPGMAGSVSTVPGSFKPWITGADDVEAMVGNLIRHVVHLVRLRAETGRTVALALEPEPCCFLETVAETIAFFRNHLHAPSAAVRLAGEAGIGRGEAEEALHRHLGVCLDLCHAAVEFEDPGGMLDALRGAGVAVAKMQVTAGLRLPRVGPDAEDRLRPFADEVYLHQVVERTPGGLRRFRDLGEAFDAPGGTADREWRVHFHVPLFLDDLGAFGSTRDFAAAVLERHRRSPVAPHLEVETYTWDVLPERHRTPDTVTGITKELAWVMQQLGRAG
ncbi:MAG TPA: metabolite traffic protein EboE [Azospirillum sp.]|nr:metabolite traffic protein EboE [Azospirillum sp.]